MVILALVAPMLGGCVYNGIQPDELDAAVDAAVAERLDAAVAAALPEAVAAELEAKGCVVEEDLVGLVSEEDLEGLVSEEDLAEYATVAYVDEAVGSVDGFATDEELADAIAGLEGTYVTHDELTASLTEYPTTYEMNDALATTASNANVYADSSSAAAESRANTYADAIELAMTSYVDDEVNSIDDRVSAIEDDYLRVLPDGTTTWSVATEAELLAAVNELDRYHIPQAATLSIEIAPGSYSFTSAIGFNHPDGGRVQVIGDVTDPSAVTLEFSGSGGIVVNQSSALRLLAGVTLVGDGTSDAHGLELEESSFANIGPMVVTNFGSNGIYIHEGSFLMGDASYTGTAGWLEVSDVGDNGVRVSHHSGATLTGIEVSDAVYYGVVVEEGSHVSADYAVLTDSLAGLYVRRGASVEANYAEVSGNRNGLEISGGSAAELSYAVLTDNTLDGAQVATGSFVLLEGADASNNGRDGFVAGTGAFSHLGSSTANNNGSNGYLSQTGAYTYAAYAVTSGNGAESYWQSTNATIYAAGATGTNTTTSSGNDVTDFIIGL